MNANDEKSQADWKLKLLSLSDPAAQANIPARLMALAMLVTGRRGREREAGEPQFGAGFRLSPEDRMFHMSITWRTGVEQVLLSFDVDDPAGPPVSLSVIRREGEKVAFHAGCQLWSPPGEGRSVIVAGGAEGHGHFVHRRGAPLRHVRGSPADDLEPGLLRGAARARRL